MRDEHLSTIPETESDEVIKSSVKNLVPIPSESEVTSDNESECDVPVKDESSPIFTTFSNPLFDCNDDFTYSDDESLPNEDVLMENFKIYSNPLFDDEEILSNKIDPHYFNRMKREHEEYICLMEKLLTINSFPHPLENFHMIIETLPTSPIPVEDSDSLREEMDIFTSTDDLMPPGIESDDYDSKGEIHFLKELLSNDSILFLENKSSDFDHHDEPSFSRPPPEPPYVKVCFDFESDSEELISAVLKNIDELIEDECFDPGGDEIDVFENIKDDDFLPMIFVIEPLYGFSPCRWCTCERCGIDLRDGFCSLCNSRNSCAYDPNLNSFDCPPDSYHPPYPTYETYSGDSSGIDSYLGYDCPPQFPLNYEPEPGYIQNYNSYPHDSLSFPQQCFDQTQPPQSPVIHPPPQETSIELLHNHENMINSVQTFLRKFNRYSFFETPKVLLLAWDRVFEIKDALGTKKYKPEDLQELFHKLSNDVQNINEELAEYINTLGWNRPAFYEDDDDDDDVDCTIAITPVLSTEEPVDFLSMGDEHLDTILVTESDEVIKSSVEDLIPIPSESKGIPEHKYDVPFHNNYPPLDVSKDQIEDLSDSNDGFSSINDDSFSIDNIDYVEASPPNSELVSSEVMEIVIPEVEEIKDDNLCEKLLNVRLLIANIKALKDNLTPSSKSLTKSSSTSPKSFLEETYTFHNSLPEFENFYFDLEEISSGSTTTHSDISLPDYEAFSFNNDYIKEISSGSTTTHSDISFFEYDSFVFDSSNDQFPPTDRSDFANEEFVDELAHIISPP
nr:pre-mRNA splicing Prp18-interacting factor [Tanacetum cinerariifolium]